MKNFVIDSMNWMLEGVWLALMLIASLIWILFIAVLALVPSVFITIGIIYAAVKLSAYLFT